jgi:regulation of enolase protein 1 (concanavalin A-like superfamily)
MDPINIETVPSALVWKNTPVSAKVLGKDSFSIASGPKTDWFVDPVDESWNCDNAPCALFTPKDEEFFLSAKVHVPFASNFDAGVIQLRVADALWGKLCFEFSPQHKPMVVTVVTHGKSDDCNHTVIDGNEVYLRAAVTGRYIAFHYSTDNSFWNLARLFELGSHKGIRVGFSSQSPTGKGCEAVFSEVRYRPGKLSDHRSGE